MLVFCKVLIPAILVTLLSLNSFARHDFSFTAKIAKLETEKGKNQADQEKTDNLFVTINKTAQNGECLVLIDIKDLPKNYETLLIKLGYKLEYFEFKKEEKISWCD